MRTIRCGGGLMCHTRFASAENRSHPASAHTTDSSLTKLLTCMLDEHKRVEDEHRFQHSPQMKSGCLPIALALTTSPPTNRAGPLFLNFHSDRDVTPRAEVYPSQARPTPPTRHLTGHGRRSTDIIGLASGLEHGARHARHVRDSGVPDGAHAVFPGRSCGATGTYRSRERAGQRPNGRRGQREL